MLVFAASDKGGTGRSITSCNILYRRALEGSDVCYLDFDFGSPTAGSIFQIPDAIRGVTGKTGLHSYLRPPESLGELAEAQRIDVWRRSSRVSLRRRPPGAGRLVFLPGDEGGAEFHIDDEAIVDRCVSLFLRLEEEFAVSLIDLSAGRSHAAGLVLRATANPALCGVTARWLVFHRWTRQHIPAAAGLAYGDGGILEAGVEYGHDRQKLRNAIRFVRTAVLTPDSAEVVGLSPAQKSWLRDCDQDLRELAAHHRIGPTVVLGSVPLDPVLQWREQLLSDTDVWARDIANRETVAAFDDLAKRIVDPEVWEAP